MLFVQMCSKPENEEEEVYFTGDQDKRLITAATQTLDLLALHLPPEKLVLHLVSVNFLLLPFPIFLIKPCFNLNCPTNFKT